MVAVDSEKIERCASAGRDAGAVHFEDMSELGAQPRPDHPGVARFLRAARDPGPLRGIGEPIWADRSPEELVECQLHEALLNVAFADGTSSGSCCPYDMSALRRGGRDEARCSHPYVVTDHARARARVPRHRRPLGAVRRAARAAADQGRDAGVRALVVGEVRDLVARRADAAGLTRRGATTSCSPSARSRPTASATAAATGVVRVWRDALALQCEVRDRGRIDDPLVGRHARERDQIGGWGVWIAHQVSDLVQVRSGADGTVVRLRMRCA